MSLFVTYRLLNYYYFFLLFASRFSFNYTIMKNRRKCVGLYLNKRGADFGPLSRISASRFYTSLDLHTV